MYCRVCGKEDDFFYEINGHPICTDCANKTVQQLYDESDFPIIELKSMVVAEKIPDVICYHDAIGAKKFHLVQDVSDYEMMMSRIARGNLVLDCQCAIEEIPDGYGDEELVYADTDSAKNNAE